MNVSESIPTETDATRELAFRENDGLEVRLVWDSRSDRLIVSVVDLKRGDFLALEVARDKALDAFYHPFSYAASRPAPHTDLLRAA
jgi:hypothetical protein